MTTARQEAPSDTWKLALGATGIVFGDIGTSPLYAFRESFTVHHRLPLDTFHVLGVLSLLIWALILVVTVKYVFVTMRVRHLASRSPADARQDRRRRYVGRSVPQDD